MRVLFIWPRTRDYPIYERLIPTLTLPYIAGLTPPHWKVRFADDNHGEVDPGAEVDLVAISVNTMSAHRAYALADGFRARGIPVVLGGWHVTFCPEEAAGHADAVVVGEADDTWRPLLGDFEQGRLQPRYVSRNDTDLGKYPRVRRDLLEGRPYFTKNIVQATRGCPFRCSFCSVSTINPRYRRRPIADVVDEIAGLKGPVLFFIDDNLFIHRKYTRDLFRALAPLKKKWIGEASINIADDSELLELAVKSGMVGLLVGFESILPDSIREMNKHRTNAAERYKAQIRALHKRGVGVLAMFTFGFDHDTPDVFEKTLAFCDEADIFGASFGILTPFPGTPTHQKLASEKRLLTDDWRLYDLQHLVFDLPGWSPRRLEKLLRETEERYYGARSFLRRTWKLLKYPRLLRPRNLLLYAIVNFQYKANLRRHRKGLPVNSP
ncbi:MAG: B12-binding domain-containing radical SAM protein [Myxococcota bacterium]